MTVTYTLPKRKAELLVHFSDAGLQNQGLEGKHKPGKKTYTFHESRKKRELTQQLSHGGTHDGAIPAAYFLSSSNPSQKCWYHLRTVQNRWDSQKLPRQFCHYNGTAVLRTGLQILSPPTLMLSAQIMSTILVSTHLHPPLGYGTSCKA